MVDETRERLNEMKADVFRAMAHPVRLAVIDALQGGGMCVNEVAEAVDSERSNVSRHLAVMERAGVLRSEKRGRTVFYDLGTPCVLGFLKCLDSMLRERLAGERSLLKALGT